MTKPSPTRVAVEWREDPDEDSLDWSDDDRAALDAGDAEAVECVVVEADDTRDDICGLTFCVRHDDQQAQLDRIIAELLQLAEQECQGPVELVEVEPFPS